MSGSKPLTSIPVRYFDVSAEPADGGDGFTERVVWHVVKLYAAKSGFVGLAPHDLRRSCAKLCDSAGGELDQIHFLLGHVSVQTTERYLSCASLNASK
jgi:site-specific recombinase XerD